MNVQEKPWPMRRPDFDNEICGAGDLRYVRASALPLIQAIDWNMNLAIRLLSRLVPGLDVPSGLLRLAALTELPALLPYSHPILSTRERPVEERGLLLHVGVSSGGEGRMPLQSMLLGLLLGHAGPCWHAVVT